MEQTLLAGPLGATILRPGALHGPSAALPRGRFFTKRLIDGRSGVVLVDNGQSRFHTTSVANFADFARLAVDRPATRVLNAGERSTARRTTASAKRRPHRTASARPSWRYPSAIRPLSESITGIEYGSAPRSIAR